MKLRGIICFGVFMASIFFFTSGWLLVLIKHYDIDEHQGRLETKDINYKKHQDDTHHDDTHQEIDSQMINLDSLDAVAVKTEIPTILERKVDTTYKRPVDTLKESSEINTSDEKKATLNLVEKYADTIKSMHGHTEFYQSPSEQQNNSFKVPLGINTSTIATTLPTKTRESEDGWVCKEGRVLIPTVVETKVWSPMSNHEKQLGNDAFRVEAGINVQPRLDFFSFTQAYLYGDLVTPQVSIMEMVERKADLWLRILERFRRSRDLFVTMKHIVSSETMIVLGCLDSIENVLPLLTIAYLEQSKTVVAIHTCLTVPDTDMIDNARDELDLDNLIISVAQADSSIENGRLYMNISKGFWTQETNMLSNREQTSTLNNIFSIVEPWDFFDSTSSSSADPLVWSISKHIRCDYLILLPDTIDTILNMFLPVEAEIMIAFITYWCDLTAFVEPNVWRSHVYWSSADNFVSSAMNDLFANRKSGTDDLKFFPLYPYYKANVNISKRKIILIALQKLIYFSNDKTWSGDFSIGTQPCSHLCNGIQGFSTTALRMFQISNHETWRIVAAGFKHNSRLDCIVSNKVEVRYDAGKFLGCEGMGKYCYEDSRDTSFTNMNFGRHLRTYGELPLQLNFAYRNDGRSSKFVSNHSHLLFHISAQGSCVCDESRGIELPFKESVSFSHKESGIVARWWRILKHLALTEFSALVVGDNLGMVAIKLARWAPSSLVVCRRFSNHDSLEQMARVLGVENVMTALDDTSIPITIRKQPSTFSHVLLGVPNLIKYLESCRLVDWEFRIGAIISTAAHKAWIEIPRLVILQEIFNAITSDCQVDFSTRYNYNEITLLKYALDAVGNDRVVTMKILSKYNNKFNTEFDTELKKYNFPANEHLLIQLTFMSSSSERNQDSIHHGSVSVQNLLDVGIRPVWKKKMLHSHLEDLAVWQLSSKDASFIHRDALHFGPDSRLRTEAQNDILLSRTMRLFSPNEIISSRIRHPPWSNITLWTALHSYLRESPAEGRNGHFSLFEWGSTMNSISESIASEYPNATIVAVSGKTKKNDENTSRSDQKKPANLIRCGGIGIDRALSDHMYESPELARYSLLRVDELFDKSTYKLGLGTKQQSSLTVLDIAFTDKVYSEAQKIIGALVSSALTSFIPMPSAQHVSIAMCTMFGDRRCQDMIELNERFTKDSTRDSSYNDILDFDDFEARLFERISRQPSRQKKGDRTIVTVRSASTLKNTLSTNGFQRLAPWPLARVDLVSLTRPVHHHFDWSRDGHKRTYTMHIEVNDSCIPKDARHLDTLRGSILLNNYSGISDPSGGGILKLRTLYSERLLRLPIGHHVSNGKIMHVYLIRDEDNSYIPYGSIHSITLIAAMRLGLAVDLRRRAFSKFVKLPLYEDMAPWNIAFAADKLMYIDYDTRNETYDADVAKVYRVLSVLMNYKRTVQDFDMCGTRAKTPYGFSHVSECVRPKTFQGECDYTSRYPVPCDDGMCHSDYISCLRSLCLVTREEVDGICCR